MKIGQRKNATMHSFFEKGVDRTSKGMYYCIKQLVQRYRGVMVMTKKKQDQLVLGILLFLSIFVNLLIMVGILNTYCWFWNLLLLFIGLLLLVDDASPYKQQVSYPMCSLYLGWGCSVLFALSAGI